MRQEVGVENFYIFGLTTPEVQRMLGQGAYEPSAYYHEHKEIRMVLDALRDDRFSPNEPGLFRWVVDKLMSPNERYMHLADFMSYLQTHDQAEQDYQDKPKWRKMAILNVARMGKFSADRAVREYARDIWNIKPAPPKG